MDGMEGEELMHRLAEEPGSGGAPARGRWVEAADCKTVHPYGEEGWRPGGPDQPHEHWIPWRVALNVVDGELIAPGFRLYSPDSWMGAIGDSWVIIGILPREGAWRIFNHYDLQGKLVAEGLLRPEHCDSELGMFCVYPPDESTARYVGRWLDERL